MNNSIDKNSIFGVGWVHKCEEWKNRAGAIHSGLVNNSHSAKGS